MKRILIDHGYLRAARDGLSVDRTGSPVPWYTFPAVEFLSGLDFSGRRVFEYGSGGSTLWWAARAGEVVAVENDPGWYERVRPQLDSQRVTYVLATERDPYVNAIAAQGEFDVVVVDGFWRGRCAEVAHHCLREGGMFILDNSEWFPEVTAMLRSADLIEIDFSGFGPLADHSSTTSIFLHRASKFAPLGGSQPKIPRGGMAIPEWRRRSFLEDPTTQPDRA
ncbi:MAG: O-methyltransferase [Acidimicrobiales bacterium]